MHPANNDSRIVWFLALSAGSCLFFILNSFFEEMCFRGEDSFSYSGFLTTQELFGFALFAVLQEVFLSGDGAKSRNGRSVDLSTRFKAAFFRKAPINAYVTLTIALTAARILTYWSLEYLNYPTQIIFKSMKLPVVIVGNFLMFQKIYPMKDYASAVLLSLSAALFSLGDAEVAPNFSMKGIVIVILSLVGDAVFSNMQEKILQTYQASSEEMLIYSNGFGGLMSLVGILFTGELVQAMSHIATHTWIMWALLVRSVILYVAVFCVVRTIRDFGVVSSTFVTTFRKILSIWLSFLMFPKPFSYKYTIAVIVFIAGIAFQIKWKGSPASPPKKDKSSALNLAEVSKKGTDDV